MRRSPRTRLVRDVDIAAMKRTTAANGRGKTSVIDVVADNLMPSSAMLSNLTSKPFYEKESIETIDDDDDDNNDDNDATITGVVSDDIDNDENQVSDSSSFLKRPSRKRRDRKRVESDVDNVSLTHNSDTKMRKLDYLSTANLNAITLYSVLNMQPFEALTVDFKRDALANFTVIKQSYANNRDEDGVNSYEFIMDTATLAYRILTNLSAKSIYDDYVHDMVNFEEDITDVVNRYETIDSEFRHQRDAVKPVLKKDYVTQQVGVAINREQILPKPRKNTAFNRILVHWQVHNDNENNENVTTQLLIDHFSRYGVINGVVMCAFTRGCAIVEFSTQKAQQDALGDRLYEVKAYNNETFNKENVDTLNVLCAKLEQMEKDATKHANVLEHLINENLTESTI